MFSDDTSTVFRDVITLALAGFVAVVILLLPWVNPPGTKEESKGNPPGDVIFEATWPDEFDTDVDQWVAAPGDVPVGYSNKGGLICNLLRDDLGHYSDPLEVNHEITVCRGIQTAGEYAINLHLYRNGTRTLPIPVYLKVSVRSPEGNTREVLRTRATLNRVGREITVVRFKLTENGTLVTDSVHSLYRPLRRFGSS
ncbi:MAG: hypothetical protein GWN84_11450 [Gammaproteobacteria bacterium]|nr:hypothetical protein [Gammaproteobacteria bacterium]NIR83481.1 hypothetical protein [Gammaproteobacteria bacterium]NIR91403.1 hypothetical protein [Gammaproteobacteria bacterium]NIU04643.1 hypothetical protein [Gammaproteobacteria bacterium]NIV51685.1 hypothetical protein [Gammaproteobacteria bacterium]